MSRPTTPQPDQATAVFSRRALLEAAESEDVRPEDARPDATGSETGSETGPDSGTATEPAAREATGTRSGDAKTDRATTDAADGPDEAHADAEGADAGSGAAGSGAADSGDGSAIGTEGSAEIAEIAEIAEDSDASDASDASDGSDGDEVADAEPTAGRGAEETEEGDTHPRERGAAAPADAASPVRPTAGGTGDTTGPEAVDPAQGAADDHGDADVHGDAPEAAGTRAGGDLGVRRDAAPVDAAQAAAEAARAEASVDAAPHASQDGVRDGIAADTTPVAEPKADKAAGSADVRSGSADVRSGAAAADPDVDGPVVDEAAASGAEVADGVEPSQGPPTGGDESRAGGDESRAGGAGGESGGEGVAEPGRGVDQPTAVFRAPRVPAVDQPTTMLKLGNVPRPAAEAKVDADADADADAKGAVEVEGAGDEGSAGGVQGAPPVERTSKFVALKSLDETAPPKPPAATTPPATTPPAEATRALPQVGPERTTQQPLPPRPPLDLLAELTNTPPPRQTPVRTIIRRVKIWTPLAILLVIVFAIAQAVRPLPTPALALTADGSYAFKGDKVALPWPDEGQGWMDVNGIGTMDSFGEQKPVAIGSVAKAMTAYVILKEHPMKPGAKGATIPVDAKAETEGGYDKDGESTLNTVKEGDQLTQYDAIAAIMIPSANNIARLLARWDSGGSEEEFVKKMNAAAKDLGMKNTTYTDPSGLKETTVSTAEDQVKLGNELVKMKALTDITRLPSWKDPSGQPWTNYNRLVPYNNSIGIKTGTTSAAGGNLLFAATQEVGGETAIVVGAILGQHTPPIIDTVNAVSKTAMIAAQEALTSDTILKKGDVVGYVDDGLGGRTPVVVTKNVSAVGWAGKTVKLELDASATIPHEAKSGTEVGKLIVGEGSGEGVEVPVALQQDLTEPGFLTKLTRVT
ncbi:D-alanyl-D-alanine carboxypeptidase [Streptomyces phaeolivaceus]